MERTNASGLRLYERAGFSVAGALSACTAATRSHVPRPCRRRRPAR